MVTNQNDIAYQELGVGVTTLESIEEEIRYNQWICSRIIPYLGNSNLELGAGMGAISNLLRKEHSDVDFVHGDVLFIDELRGANVRKLLLCPLDFEPVCLKQVMTRLKLNPLIKLWRKLKWS